MKLLDPDCQVLSPWLLFLHQFLWVQSTGGHSEEACGQLRWRTLAWVQAYPGATVHQLPPDVTSLGLKEPGF